MRPRGGADRWTVGGALASGVALSIIAAGADVPQRGDSAVSSGAQTYRTYCVSCHGERGQGDGPLAPLLAAPLPDLSALSRRNGGRFPFEKVRRTIDGRHPIKAHGAMPAWGDAFLDPAETGAQAKAMSTVAQLVSFLASIQRQNGDAGTASALCVFANPGYAGRCTETVPLAEGSSPRAACEEVLGCLNSAACVKVYCGTTTLRQGWTLESARRIIVQP